MKSISVFILSLFLVFGCERSQTTRAGYDPGVERDHYEERVRARLNEFEHRFDGLDARLKGLDKSSQEHLRIDIAELRDRKDAIEDKFADLRKVSNESWIDLRNAVDQSIDQLELAYNIVAANNHEDEHAPLDQYRRSR